MSESGQAFGNTVTDQEIMTGPVHTCVNEQRDYVFHAGLSGEVFVFDANGRDHLKGDG